MGKPSKFNGETLLDTALVVVDRDGKAATTADIAAAVEARVGSLCYRFANHEILLLALWIRSIRRFQIDFLAAAESSGGPGEALAAATVTIPRCCREHPGEAKSLTLFRHEGVLACLKTGDNELAACPNDLQEVAQGLNDEVAAVMAGLTRRHFEFLEPLELVRIVVQQTTYGLVRPLLGSGAGPIPAWLDDMVAAMVPAALMVADRPGWSEGRG